MQKIFLLIFLISMNIYAQDTVVIEDESGEVKICRVTTTGAIVCL